MSLYLSVTLQKTEFRNITMHTVYLYCLLKCECSRSFPVLILVGLGGIPRNGFCNRESWTTLGETLQGFIWWIHLLPRQLNIEGVAANRFINRISPSFLFIHPSTLEKSLIIWGRRRKNYQFYPKSAIPMHVPLKMEAESSPWLVHFQMFKK